MQLYHRKAALWTSKITENVSWATFPGLLLTFSCPLSSHPITCRHRPQKATPHQPLQSPQMVEVSRSPAPLPALTKPVTCGEPEQENQVDEHEATQVSQDHLQERASLSEPGPGRRRPQTGQG